MFPEMVEVFLFRLSTFQRSKVADGTTEVEFVVRNTLVSSIQILKLRFDYIVNNVSLMPQNEHWVFRVLLALKEGVKPHTERKS